VSDALAAEVIDAINEVSGAHQGYRAAHAKGTLCAGTFAATPAAARLTRAEHMQGATFRATVRFSNGGGNPELPDYGTEGRGMAVKLYLDGGERTDMVALSLPVFFTRTPEHFLEFTRLRKPDPATGQPDMERLGAWLGEHPEALPAIQAAMSAPPPASYATCLYHGIHAFRYLDASGKARFVRFRWEPEAGVETLSIEEARERGPNYLQEEIVARLANGGAGFRLMLVLAESEDPTDDPTASWPDERETVDAGRLELTGPETERERGGDVLVFDPTRVVEGIELSDDPILRFRQRAYSESVARRSAVAAKAG
jgi:catalase